MSSTVFTNNFPQVRREYQSKKQRGLRAAGQDLFRAAGPRTPLKKGNLRRMTSMEMLGASAIVLVWSARYAAVQNAGHRNGATGRFRNYTTGGTGAGFVELGIGYVRKRFAEYFR